jgi:hypothetical protein
MDTLLDLGSALVSSRRAQGITQHELGERVGATQQQVARWESRAYANVDLARVARVANALGVAPHGSSASMLVAAEPVAAYGTAGSAGLATHRSSSRIEFSPAELRAVCRRRAVRRLALFGSVLRDDFGRDSDIDVLVEFDDEAFDKSEIYRLPDELREVFGGRKIDLVEPESLSSRLREHVLAEAWDVFTKR